MPLKAGEGMSKPAASPGPGGITGSQTQRGLISFSWGTQAFWGWKQWLGQGWGPQEESGSSCETHSSLLSPLQRLQELQAREVVVSNLGTLRDSDTEETRWQTPSRAELRGKRERMAVQVSSAVPMSSPLLRSPGGAFGWRWTHVHAPLCICFVDVRSKLRFR